MELPKVIYFKVLDFIETPSTARDTILYMCEWALALASQIAPRVFNNVGVKFR